MQTISSLRTEKALPGGERVNASGRDAVVFLDCGRGHSHVAEMPPTWLSALAWTSLATALACAAWLALQHLRHPQKMAVMNFVWPLNALYLGPFAVWAYHRFGRPGTKERGSPAGSGAGADRPGWQATLVADMHCGAGCTLGDLIAEWTVFLVGLRIGGQAIWPELILDFVAAYVLGIVFQYLTIAPMRGQHGWEGIKAALKADTLSLLAFEVGLFGWMLLTRFVFFANEPLRPDQAAYWLMMQVGMVIGYLTSYPVNGWLLRARLKEAM